MVDIIRGLVRPLLTLGGFAVLSYGFIIGKVPADTYVPMVGMMVAFWFATRKSGNT